MLATSVIHIIGFKMSVSDDGAEGYSIEYLVFDGEATIVSLTTLASDVAKNTT